MKSLPQALSRPRALFIRSRVLTFASVVIWLSAAAAAATGTLTLTPTSVWAGNIGVGQSATLPCTLKNSGAASLTISKATSNNSAYALSSPALPLTLAAGKSSTCAVKFSPKAVVRYTGTVTFASNASNPSIGISLAGWGVAGKIVASQPAIAFGSVADGSRKTASETLTNTGTTTLKISSANTNGHAFGRTGITPPVSLAPGASITFTAFFVPTSSGAATGSITVLSDGTNPTLSIPLSGTGSSTGVLAVSPASASLGSVTVGSSKSMTATLSATGSSVVVSSATTTNSEFGLTGMSFPVTIAAGQSASFSLKFAPSSAGATSAKLSFVSSAAGSPTVETVTGTGTAAASHRVTLQWGASASAVSGYNVYRGTVSGGPYTKQTSALDGNTSYADSGVQAGQTYYYVVTGVTATGTESKYSNQVKAVVPTP